MPTVSVVIPTYNRERYVVKAVESVLHQSYGDYEIIVIDDGSSDATATVLKPYLRKIRYLHQENAGVSAARNAGVREAHGRWIAFLDSDDEWLEGYLSSQMAQAARHPEAAGHIANAVTVSADGSRSNHFEELELLGGVGELPVLVPKPFKVIVGHSHWFLQSTVMRRDALIRCGLLNPRLTIAEDMDLLARMALTGPFSFSPQVLVEIYRREEAIENLASQYVRKGIYSREAYGTVFEGFLALKGLSRAERRTVAQVFSSNRRALGNLLLAANRGGEARDAFRKALLLHPCARSLIKYLAAFLPQQVALALVTKGKQMQPGE